MRAAYWRSAAHSVAGFGMLRDQRSKQVERFNVLIVMADGQTLRVRQRFLEFSGELVDSHQETSNFRISPK